MNSPHPHLGAQKFKDLSNIHSIQALIYSKTQFTKDLARKLRPEFKKIYLTYETKSSIRMISRDDKRDTDHGGIDIVIMEYDGGCFRLIEYVNQRVTKPETRHLPVIPMIVLLPSNLSSMSDAYESAINAIESAGGANVTLMLPQTTRNVFTSILDVLGHRRCVDVVFKEMKKKAVKYPFYAIFTESREEMEKQTKESFQTAEYDDCVFDDWTNCHSHLPREIEEIRETELSKRREEDNYLRDSPSTASATETLQSHEGEEVVKVSDAKKMREKRLKQEMKHRQQVDKTLSNIQVNNLSVKSKELLVDTEGSSGSELDDEEEEDEDLHSRKDSHASSSPVKSQKGHIESCEVLLDQSKRPHWRRGVRAGFGPVDPDLKPFIEKPYPDITTIRRTVSGHNKDLFDDCWRTLRSPMRLATPFLKTAADGNLSRPTTCQSIEEGCETPTSRGGGRPVSTPGSVGPSNSGSRRGSVTIGGVAPPFTPQTARSTTPLSSARESIFNSPRKGGGGAGGTDILILPNTPNTPNTPTTTRLPNVANISPPPYAGSLDDRKTRIATKTQAAHLSLNIKAIKRAERTLAKASMEAPQDIQIYGTLEPDISTRKLNQGERELIEEGNRLILEEDYDRACVYYTRAGLHASNYASIETTSDPHVDSSGTTGIAGAPASIGANHGASSPLPPASPAKLNQSSNKITIFNNNNGSNGSNSMSISVKGSSNNASASGSTKNHSMTVYSGGGGGGGGSGGGGGGGGSKAANAHLSKLYLGITNYKRGKYLTAIKYFNSAVSLIPNIKDANIRREDGFKIYYNRAISKFMCGDDESGVEDLVKALEIKPNSFQAMDVHALALRRMGEYNKSIEQSMKSIEKKKQALLGTDQSTSHHPLSNGEDRFSPHSPGSPHSDSLRESNGFRRMESLNRSTSTSHFRLPQDDFEQKAILNRTVPVAIEEPRSVLSFKERKQRAFNETFEDSEEGGANGGESSGGANHRPNTSGGGASRLSLAAFKQSQGLKNDLFEHLFIRQTPLQEALIEHPYRRRRESIQIIKSALRLVPLLKSLSEGSLEDLAMCIEYRLITSKGHLFQQGNPAGGTCILLRGQVEMKIDLPNLNQSLIIGKINNHEAFGHIDLLFRQDDHRLLEKIQKMIKNIDKIYKPSTANSHSASTTATTDTTAIAAVAAATAATAVTAKGNSAPHSATHTARSHDGQSTNSASTISHDHSHRNRQSISQGQNHSPPSRRESNSAQSLPATAATAAAAAVARTIQEGRSFEKNADDVSTTEIDDGNQDELHPHHHLRFEEGVFDLNQDGEEKPVPTKHEQSTDTASANSATDDIFYQRAYQPGTFSTYSITDICELLIISHKDFYRLLYTATVDDFLKRLQIVCTCGIFAEFPWQERVRLARMSQVQSFATNEVILRQGEKPSFIYIVLDGLCSVFAKPNNAEILERKLIELQEKADNHDLKYAYHHKLKTNLTRSILSRSRAGTPSAALDQPSADRRDKKSTSITWEHNITHSEIERQELDAEINEVKRKLRKTKSNNLTVNDLKVDATNKFECHQVTTLRSPMIFGEASILDPENGTSRGTVIAESFCHILMIHKLQIQTFQIEENVLTRTRERAVIYPDDIVIENSLARAKDWKHFKEREMHRIKKSRWPKSIADDEPFVV